MNNYYALIHYDGGYVSGYLLIGYPDPESARRGAIRELSQLIAERVAKMDGRGDDQYHRMAIKKMKSYRKAFLKPWRKTKERFAHRSSPWLEMVEMSGTMVLSAGYWLGEDTGKAICNRPRTREERPQGYCVSRLKGTVGMS